MNIDIQKTDMIAPRRQGDGQPGRYARFSNPSLTAHDHQGMAYICQDLFDFVVLPGLPVGRCVFICIHDKPPITLNGVAVQPPSKRSLYFSTLKFPARPQDSAGLTSCRPIAGMSHSFKPAGARNAPVDGSTCKPALHPPHPSFGMAALPVNSMAPWTLPESGMLMPDEIRNTATGLLPGDWFEHPVAQRAAGHRPHIASSHIEDCHHLVHLRGRQIVMNQNHALIVQRIFDFAAACQNDPPAARQSRKSPRIRGAGVHKRIESDQAEVPGKFTQGAVGDECQFFLRAHHCTCSAHQNGFIAVRQPPVRGRTRKLSSRASQLLPLAFYHFSRAPVSRLHCLPS